MIIPAEFNCFSSTSAIDFEQEMVDTSLYLTLSNLALPGKTVPQIITFDVIPPSFYPSYYGAILPEHLTWVRIQYVLSNYSI